MGKGQAGQAAQPQSEVVVGPTNTSGVNQTSEIDGAKPSTNHVPAKLSWQISPGVLDFAAELINRLIPLAGNLRLPGQSNLNFLLSVIECDGIVKKQGPHNPAQDYKGLISFNYNQTVTAWAAS